MVRNVHLLIFIPWNTLSQRLIVFFFFFHGEIVRKEKLREKRGRRFEIVISSRMTSKDASVRKDNYFSHQNEGKEMTRVIM